MGDVQPANVPIASPSEIVSLEVMIADIADRGRTSDEIVLVVMTFPAVEIGMETQLRGVALCKKILAKNIRDKNLLITPIKLIEVGVGIFLQHVEGNEIVLPEVI